MNAWLIVVVGLVYAYVAVNSYLQGNTSQAIIFAGYAFSNVGLYLAAR